MAERLPTSPLRLLTKDILSLQAAMSYRLERGEPVPGEIRRIVSEEADFAIKHLTNTAVRRREEAIHEARKSIKKIRGVLRLVRSDFGRTYRDENRTLRDAGRRLSQIRDAEAVIEVFDDLVQRYRGDLQKNVWAAIRRGLETGKREVEMAAGIDSVLRQAAAALRRIARDVKRWPLQHDGFQAIESGLAGTYKRGRKALAEAQRDPTPDNYHYFRKRVKDHWYHVRLLENLWTEEMKAREAGLKDLQNWLGDDHNLVVLREKLQQEPDKFGKRPEADLFCALAGQYQAELRDKSVSLGLRLYEQKPKRFTQSMSHLWGAWETYR
ncbi:MAG TPA: CHAD domain-containing protein [Bryobacteraceae bacterium]|jgi:CHAD domain-containing protein|nr:CHAD domain-containing protein [Bryobacteraceae bacterium]